MITAPQATLARAYAPSAVSYIDSVISCVPSESDRNRIEQELLNRIDPSISIEQAIATYGHPREVAEFYLSSVPLVPAPFFRRVGAALIDIPSVILAALGVFYVGWKLFGSGNSIAAVALGNPVAIALCFIALIMASPLYYIIAETWTSQTVGKALMGIRTVRESGAKITVGQAIIRQIPLFFSAIYSLDVLFALFTKKKQRLFELISKTRVVRA